MSTEPNFSDPETPPREKRKFPWLIILTLAALVLVPLAVWEYPREVARWKVARAAEQREKGDKDAAYTVLDELLEDDPENITLLLLRSSWQMEDEQGDRALADLDRAVAADPTNLAILLLRSEVCTTLGKDEQAVHDIDTVVKAIPLSSPKARAMTLNQAAYMRAVANIELDQAAKQIDEALDLVQNMEYYDTRGYILWRQEKYPEALADMNLAIGKLDDMIAQFKLDTHPEAERKVFYKNAAVVYYHRGLVHDSLDDEAAAEKDFAQVREWGFEPGEELY